MSNTQGEDEGEMKSCGFITKTWGGGGMYGGSLSQDGNRGHAERTMGTWGEKGAEDGGMVEDTLVLVARE